MADRLRLTDLCVRIGDRCLVDHVSFELVRGSVVALVGASGSGKTLTCRALLGMVDLEPGVVSGELQVPIGGGSLRPYDGLLGAGRRARDRAFAPVRGAVVGYLPQDGPQALDPYRRVGRQIADAARLGGDASEPPDAWLARAGFERSETTRIAQAWPHELSGGMAQRVAVAQALARRSVFLVADEPTTGLDAPIQRRLARELRRLADAGLGVLLVTHELRLLAGLADHVHVMDRGRIIETLAGDRLSPDASVTAIARQLLLAEVAP